MSCCIIAIPLPRRLGWSDAVRHSPWSMIWTTNAWGSVQKVDVLRGRPAVGVLDAVARRLAHGRHQVIFGLPGQVERCQPSPYLGAQRCQLSRSRRPGAAGERSRRASVDDQVAHRYPRTVMRRLPTAPPGSGATYLRGYPLMRRLHRRFICAECVSAAAQPVAIHHRQGGGDAVGGSLGSPATSVGPVGTPAVRAGALSLDRGHAESGHGQGSEMIHDHGP
jgi:hypothetical protein